MVKLYFILLVFMALCSCAIFRTDADGTPNNKGGYETRKVAGVTYSCKPIVSESAQTDAKIIRFLLVIAATGLIGLLGGVVSLFLDRTNRFPCPWWDELIAVSIITIGIALVSIKLYHIFTWIVLTGAVSYACYLVYKAIRISKTKKKGAS